MKFRYSKISPFSPGNFLIQLSLGGGDISYISPVGKELLLKRVGDEVKVNVPAGVFRSKEVLPLRKKWLIVTGAVVLAVVMATVAFATNPIKLIVNGQEIKPDVPPQIINGRTMVPVKWVAEALGADVEWDDKNRAVIIKKDTQNKIAVTDCCSRLKDGTLADAERAVGFRAWQPAYLPAGAVAEEKVYWDETLNFLEQYYHIGEVLSPQHLSFSIGQTKASITDFEERLRHERNNGAETVKIGNQPGFIYEERPEPGDNISKGWVKICWYQDSYIFTVGGPLDLKEELSKIADSLKPPTN